MYLLMKRNPYKFLLYTLLLSFILLNSNISFSRNELINWEVIHGHWEIKDDVIMGEIDRGKAIIHSKTSLWNVEIECLINPLSERAGIIFNMQNLLNYYELVIEKQNILLILRTTETTRYLASKKIPKSKEYRLRIVQEGNNIKITSNGDTLFIVNDTTFNSGYYGLSVQNGKAYFSSIIVKGREPIKMENNLLKISIDEVTGTIKSLAGLLNNRMVQFCDNTPLEPNNPWGWGTVVLDYGEGLITSNKMKHRIYDNKDEKTVEYTGDKVKITVKRMLSDSFLDETYTISSLQKLNLNTLGVVFRPTITMHVGEQSSYFLVDNTPTVYHWFTGKNLAYLLLTHNNGRSPHLAIVLVDGEMNGYTPLYNLGIRHIPLASSPVLFVTGRSIDSRDTEYHQPEIIINPDKPLSFTLRYFLFEDWKDMEHKFIDICSQPVFHYSRYIPVGKYLEIEIETPSNLDITSVRMNNNKLSFTKVADNKYLIRALVKFSGLQKVEFSFNNGNKTFILFEGMRNLRELIDKRAEFILRYQFDNNPNSVGFSGVFPVDLLTKESMADPKVGNCQQAGTGEITASTLIIIYKNLTDPNKEEIAKIEKYANEWLRKKCQDNNYACYLNPLDKALEGNRMGFRIWNANWISTIYYYLSLFDEKYLTLQTRDTYLLWAYNTLKWFFNNKPTYISPEPHMIKKIIKELNNRGYKREALELETMKSFTLESIISQSQELSKENKEWTMDANAFVPMATFLFNEGYYKEAYTFLEPTITDLGYSYDPRTQSAFRIWDDAASGYFYKLIPYPTMPHFWTSIVGYPLLLEYERTGKEEFLEAAYNSIMSFYESYNADYPYNLWRKLDLGEAHAGFLPGLKVNTQERACSDQDGSFSTYIETFGTKCYVIKSGRTINCDINKNRITSWAAYPRGYILDNKGYKISVDSIPTVINFIELDDNSITLEIENLMSDNKEASITINFKDGKIIKIKDIFLKPFEKRLLKIDL
ncbi:MAG: hypothetical protein ACP5K2_08900 [bacterium]